MNCHKTKVVPPCVHNYKLVKSLEKKDDKEEGAVLFCSNCGEIKTSRETKNKIGFQK